MVSARSDVIGEIVGVIGLRSGARFAVLGLAVLVLVGCASATEPPESAPSTAASDSPAPTPSSDTPDWYYKEDVMERTPLPGELTVYRDMPVEEFAALPKSEQWLYVSWLTQYRDEFMEWFAVASGDGQSKPFDLTPASTIQQKIEYDAYTYRMGAYQTVGAPEPTQAMICGDLDQDAITKIYLAATLNADRGFKDANDVIAAQSGKAYCPSGLAIGNSFDKGTWSFDAESPATQKIDGVPVDGVTLDYSIDGGAKQIQVFVIESPTYDGTMDFHTITNYLAGVFG